jgi:DNA-directed RNA polymerase specialized sigma24 family protein
MNLSTSKDKQLRDRGRAWFCYIGIVTPDGEDILQSAMLSLYKEHDHFSDVDQEIYADKNWKRHLDWALGDWIKKTGRYQAMLDRYADSLELYPDRKHFILEARNLLLESLPLLTETELVVCIALMENDFNAAWAAEELDCDRTNIYKAMSRAHKRLTKKFDLTHNPASKTESAEVEYLGKTGDYLSEDVHWKMNHPFKTEVFDIDDITREELFDREEAAKVWPVTVIQGEQYGR